VGGGGGCWWRERVRDKAATTTTTSIIEGKKGAKKIVFHLSRQRLGKFKWFEACLLAVNM